MNFKTLPYVNILTVLLGVCLISMIFLNIFEFAKSTKGVIAANFAISLIAIALSVTMLVLVIRLHSKNKKIGPDPIQIFEPKSYKYSVFEPI